MSNTLSHVYAVLDDDDRLQTIFTTRDKAEDWLSNELYPEYFQIVEVILDEDAELKEKKHMSGDHDKCPECGMPHGNHKMDCSRGRV